MKQSEGGKLWGRAACCAPGGRLQKHPSLHRKHQVLFNGAFLKAATRGQHPNARNVAQIFLKVIPSTSLEANLFPSHFDPRPSSLVFLQRLAFGGGGTFLGLGENALCP